MSRVAVLWVFCLRMWSFCGSYKIRQGNIWTCNSKSWIARINLLQKVYAIISVHCLKAFWRFLNKFFEKGSVAILTNLFTYYCCPDLHITRMVKLTKYVFESGQPWAKSCGLLSQHNKSSDEYNDSSKNGIPCISQYASKVMLQLLLQLQPRSKSCYKFLFFKIINFLHVCSIILFWLLWFFFNFRLPPMLANKQ